MFTFTGSLSLIFDPKIVCSIMMQNPTVKVVSLDEDNAVPMLCDENNPQVVPGTILLPPIEALWAIVDEQNEQFAQIYYAHLTTPECMQYMAALLAAMWHGTNLILYYPDQDQPTIKYLYSYLQQNYGLLVSLSAMQPFQFDPRSIPLYCNSIFSVGAMSIYDYLREYPVDARIPDAVYMDISRLLPGDTLQEKFELINRLLRVLKTRPNAVVPIKEVK